MPEKWREKMGLESSGGEKTLHILNVDDVLLDRRDWEQEKERQKGGIGVGFSGKVQGETHLNPRSPYCTNATRMDKG
jgi:hypothetical protein